MGKASKWIRNILLGKKEENFKKIDGFCPENKKENTDGSSSNKIIVKRKWSFRKITSGKTTEKVVSHNISRSFDSTDHSPKLQTQPPRSRRLSRLARVSENTEFVKTAATRIQSVFRSYLAKRALHALRGLVKLQALVRGHLVRKQTTATLRGMHALMAIQVRARIKRVKMTEEVNPLEIVQPPPHKEIPSFKGHMTQQNKDSKNMSVEEMLGVMRSRSGPLDVKSKKYEYSKSESISKRENQLKKTIITAPNSPEKYYKEMIEYLKPTTKSSDQRHIMPHRQSCSPNFMNKTESSRAKTRCRSEPKQRPPKGLEGTTKQKSKAIECRLMKQNMLSNSARYEHWIVNSMKENSKRDSFGSYTDDDSYYS